MEAQAKEIYLVEEPNNEFEGIQETEGSGILGKIVGGIVVAGIAAGGTYLVRKFIKKRKDKAAEAESLVEFEEDAEFAEEEN